MLAYLNKPAVQMALFVVAVGGAGAFFALQDTTRKPADKTETKDTPAGMGRAATESLNTDRSEVKGAATVKSAPIERFSLPPKTEPPTIAAKPPPKAEEKPKPPTFPNLVQITQAPRVKPFVPQPPKVFAPRGTLIKAALVITLESNAVGTPVLAMVTEDVYFQGNLIVPAGTQVQTNSFGNSRFRDRIDIRGGFNFIWADGSEYVVSGIALDHAPLSDGTFSLTDGSPGIRGRVLKTDDYAEFKLLVAEAVRGLMTNNQTQFQSIYGMVPENTNRNAALGSGSNAAGAYAGLLSKKIEKDLEYVQVPAGTAFYIYTIDLFEPELRSIGGLRQGNKATTGAEEQRSNYEVATAQIALRENELKARLEEARSAESQAEHTRQQAGRMEQTKALFGKPQPVPALNADRSDTTVRSTTNLSGGAPR